MSGRDIPIIFSGAMVRALLDGRKTMTRRLAWQKPRVAIQVGDSPIEPVMVPSPWQKAKPGDRLWVRETWGAPDADRPGVPGGRKPQSGDRIVLMANEADAYQWQTGHPGCGDFCWRPAIHMPRWASRLTLVVTATKVERLQDMPPDDAIAEGMKGITKDGKLVKYGLPDRDGYPGTDDVDGWPWEDWRISPVDAFERLWVSLHGPGSWAANPEVVALTFEVHKANIDATPSIAEPAAPRSEVQGGGRG